MKKILAIVLIWAMMLAATACGGRNEEAAGKYYCTSATFMDGEIGTDANTWIRLEANGDGTLTIGSERELEWKLKGEALTVKTEIFENPCTGTLKDDVIRLNMGGVMYTFVKEGSSAISGNSFAVEETTAVPETDAPAASGDGAAISIDGYEMLFTGYTLTQDSYGADAIILSYTFTNNTMEAQSFNWAMHYSVIQGGKYLNYCTIWRSGDSFAAYSDNNSTEVLPGGSIDVNLTYNLSDMVAPITVEFESINSYEAQSHTVELTGEATGSVAPTEVPADVESTANTVAGYWNGDWYGWWVFDGATGKYEDLVGDRWDCCAHIEMDAEGKGTLIFWDEDRSRLAPYAQTEVALSGERLISTGGTFDNVPLYDGEWLVNQESGFSENMICISGIYFDPDDSLSSINYYIYLRPWGTLWDDVMVSSARELPRYYFSWYLPLVSAAAPMPDAIYTGEP